MDSTKGKKCVYVSYNKQEKIGDYMFDDPEKTMMKLGKKAAVATVTLTTKALAALIGGVPLVIGAIVVAIIAVIIVIVLVIALAIGAIGSSDDSTAKDKNVITATPGLTRKEVIDFALTLNGKVKYFWGGHSDPGWNKYWGTLRIVKAGGDYTSGTLQPYGLDCSGFVEWVYRSAGTNKLNGSTVQQLQNSHSILEKDLKPGDLVFQNTGMFSANHVGIFYKHDSNGKNLYIHCQGGVGVTINSTTTFKYWRRPNVTFDDD